VSVFEDGGDVVLRVDGQGPAPRSSAKASPLGGAPAVELHGGRVDDSSDGPGHVVRLPAAPRA